MINTGLDVELFKDKTPDASELADSFGTRSRSGEGEGRPPVSQLSFLQFFGEGIGVGIAESLQLSK